MSSDNSGQKPAAPEAGLPPGSTRGPARDALAAVHNLEALLRNASVPHATLVDLLPELKAGAATLRGQFDRRPAGDEATAQVAGHGRRQVDELDLLLDAIETSGDTRESLAARTASLAYELEASEDLLALLDRAAASVFTEVGLRLIATEAGRGAARGRVITVRLDAPSADEVVTTDPYLLGPLLALLVAYVDAAGVGSLALRARSGPPAELLVEAARPEDDALPALVMRVRPWILSSEPAVRRIAGHLGARLDLAAVRGSITLGVSGG